MFHILFLLCHTHLISKIMQGLKMIKNLLYYISDSYDPYENLATEYVLTMHVPPDTCILFLWQNENTVVVGRNQNCWKECYVNQIEADGGKIARRFSGGGAVYHDLGNLNFSFCVRSEDYDQERQTEVILDAVNAFGIAAQRNGRNDIVAALKGGGNEGAAMLKSGGNEGAAVLKSGGNEEAAVLKSRFKDDDAEICKKFSGSAFFEKDDFSCHHGTLMIDADLEKLSRYLHVSRDKLMSKSVTSVRARVINLRELCSDVTVARMKTQMVASFEKIYGMPAAAMSKNQMDKSLVSDYRAQLASWQWIFGRKTTFTHQMHQKYAWGEIDFAFKVKNGMIEEINIHTDAMEAAFILQCSDALKGCRYVFDDMKKQLIQCAAANKLLISRANDMAALFKANI